MLRKKHKLSSMSSDTRLRKGLALFVIHVMHFPMGGLKSLFIMAKTRVAPLGQLSISRLELQTARLADNIKKEPTLHISETVFWSDSKSVHIERESMIPHVCCKQGV